MGKPFRFGFILGRFQQLHVGHERIIEMGNSMCEHLLVLVGSAQLQGTKRNPFPVDLRMKMLREVCGEGACVRPLADYTNETDHSYAWGQYLLEAVRGVGREEGWGKPDLMITGNDEERELWFPPEELAELGRLIVPRAWIPIRATDLRQAILAGDRLFWEKHVNPRLHPYYDELRERLAAVEETAP
ncbi:adenylyltransferase/cytidyltransferase family protein [Cohnella zeiphila]|uniref:Adenylyltransferase/cytidyltransferase family protein n=1 Tax=Cohnella zeiphila TaxID=2761120 RepID=A0A7X0SKR4_9BACL|nr:adenylyltransferase/cytidyltransferase family protein [Cohnella zeiphila]MBB6731803.1 adenylyltransferase/cytidyltransferase family protein [Cohnella zeiphila]